MDKTENAKVQAAKDLNTDLIQRIWEAKDGRVLLYKVQLQNHVAQGQEAPCQVQLLRYKGVAAQGEDSPGPHRRGHYWSTA